MLKIMVLMLSYGFLGLSMASARTHAHSPFAENINHFDAQPTADNQRHRPIHFKVEQYDLDLFLDPLQGTIEGSVVVHGRALKAPLTSISLDAYDLEIEKVETLDSLPLYFDYDRKLLQIELDAALEQGEGFAVRIHYRAPKSQSFFITGPDATNPYRSVAAYTYTQPEGSQDWFPCLDRPNSKALYKMRYTTPLAYRVLGNGHLLQEEQTDSTRTYEYYMDKPMAPYLASLAVGEFAKIQIGAYQGTPLWLWVSEHIMDSAVFETRKTAQMMQVFAELTGVAYPFATYTQSVAEAWGSSMEHQTATTMGGYRISGDGYGEGVVAHELAHHWFGDWLTCDHWGEMWLNEGFATFFARAFYEATGQNERALETLDAWRRSYFYEAKQRVRPLANPEVDHSNIFDSHAYQKGALVLRWLKHLSSEGDPGAFTRILKTYIEANSGGNVHNFDLQQAVEKTTGSSWQSFFEQWVRSPGHPQLLAFWSWNQQAGQVELHLKQRQALKADKPWRIFSFPLSIELIFADGASEKRRLDVYGSAHDFVLKSSKKVIAVQLNPDWHLPAESELIQDRSAWLALWRHSTSAITRLEAMRQLSKADPVFALDMADALAQESSPYVLLQSAEAAMAHKDNLHLLQKLAARLPQELDADELVASQTLAKIDRWLAQQTLVAPDAGTLSLWKIDYLRAKTTVQRREVLHKLNHFDRSLALDFAKERLTEPHWVTRDRSQLIDAILAKPDEPALAWALGALQGEVSYYWERRIISHLIRQQIQDPRFLPWMQDRLHTARYVGSASRALGYLGRQGEHREQLCPWLDGAKGGFSPYINSKIEQAWQHLGCDPEGDWVIEDLPGLFEHFE